MVSIYKRGVKLYLQFTVDGKRRQKSTGLDDTKANRKLLKTQVIPALEREILTGTYTQKMRDVAAGKETIEKYAEKYLSMKESLKTYWEIHSRTNDIISQFKGRTVRSITRGEVRDLVAKKLKSVKPKTVRNYLGTLKAIFDLAIEYDVITVNPAENISLPSNRTERVEPFTTDEMIRLINAADGWFKNFLAVSFYTGMRTGEAVGLMWSDIDFDRMEISISRSIRRGIVSSTKTESGNRKVPIFSPLIPYLKDQRRNSKSLYVFANRDGKHFGGADSLRKKWARVCDDAGVRYRKLYATRHTFVTSMLKSGEVSVLELAQMVGHKNSEPIMKNYAQFVSGEHLKIKREFSPYATDSIADIG